MKSKRHETEAPLLVCKSVLASLMLQMFLILFKSFKYLRKYSF